MPRRGQTMARRVIGDPADPDGMACAVAGYLERLAVRNYSPATIKDHAKTLAQLTMWLDDRGITRPAEVTKPILERWQRHLFHVRKPNGAPLAFHTQAGRLSAARGLFRHLARTNRILYNPAADLELPKIEQRLPKAVLTAGETEQVLAAPNVDTILGLRDRAILETLYSTGMRRKELVGLHLEDVDRGRGVVMIRLGKGRKDRVVPIGERALIWIATYLDHSRSALVVPPDPGVLFVTQDGLDFTPDRLSALVTNWVDRSPVAKRGSCHLFRHTMATLMLEGGADLRYIQEILGHADVRTTQIYTRVSILTLKAIHETCHPAASNSRHRSPNHPSLANTNRHDEGDVDELLEALDEEQQQQENSAVDAGRRSAAGDTAALDTTAFEEHHHDHPDQPADRD